MTRSDIITELFRKLDETGLANKPGALLFSGLGTLVPGDLYLMSYNPGGDPSSESVSVKAHLEALEFKVPDWSEYIDAVWCPKGRPYPPGSSGMQTRIRGLLENIGLPTRTVCASVLIFARSRVADDLKNWRQLAKQCWPVHRYLLDRVRPKAIVSIGKGAFGFILEQGVVLSKPETFPSGQDKLLCRAARMRLGDLNMSVVSVPHMGDRIRYDIGPHPEALNWVRSRLGL